MREIGRFILLLVGVTAVPAASVSAEVPKAPYLTDADQALAQAAEADKEALIYFFSETCKWCHKLDTVVLTDSGVVDFFTNEMVLAKINGKQDTVLRDRHKVSAFPTLVMIGKDGAEIDRIVGYLPPDAFLKTLRQYRQGIGTLADLLSRVEKAPDRELFFKIADKYKYRGGEEEATGWYQKVIEMGDPKDSLTWESRMALADMHRRAKEYDRAVESFSAIIDDFEGTKFGADAEVWRAYVLQQKGDTTAALKAYEAFIQHYPESEDAEFAGKQIAKLKGVAEKEN
ncbi:MAG: thioredoxin fold domain-containing protein [Candidatus Zixiibacteriota bacterium]